MILEKQLPDDPTPADAPPAYDTVASSNASTSYNSNEKSGSSSKGIINDYRDYVQSPLPALPASSSTSISSPVSPSLASSSSQGRTYTPSSSYKGKGKATSSWFPFGQASRTSKEVKTTVLGLIKDLVNLSETNASLAVLDSCAEACQANNVSFSDVLQEKSIEGHSSLYWAIVKRPNISDKSDGGRRSEDGRTQPDLVSALLSFAEPLTDDTISEIRRACLDTSDQALFQRLRQSPAFAPLSGSDKMLLGVTVPPDEVEVEDVAGDEGAFVVRMNLVMFQKRMRVTKKIEIEFLARGRIWKFSFFISDRAVYGGQWHDKGVWLVALSLLEHSPPTWLDSRLIIEDARSSETTAKLKPTVSIRLKTGPQQLTPSKGANPGTTVFGSIVASLDDSLMGNSLQYDGSSYISPDGSLKARIEAKLGKPDAECIIC